MPKILLIDDHSMIQKGLTSFFQNNNFEICSTLSSFDEVKNFCSNPLKFNDDDKIIAIVDIELGKDSGFDVIPLLNSVGIDSIIYSMYSSPSYVVKSIEAGTKGFVSKAAKDEELLSAVKSALNGEIYIQKDLVSSFMYSASIFSSLTSKEKQIIDYVRNHLDNNQIAKNLGISKRTVENHLSRIYDKFGVENKHQLEEKIK